MSTSPPELLELARALVRAAEDGLLTEEEVAAKLKVCSRSLRKERQAGRLPYILIGRSVRYAPSDIEQFLIRARTVATPRVKRKGGKGSPNRSNGVIVPFSKRGRG